MKNVVFMLCAFIFLAFTVRGQQTDTQPQSRLKFPTFFDYVILMRCDSLHIHFREQGNTVEILSSLVPDFTCTIEQGTHLPHTTALYVFLNENSINITLSGNIKLHK